MTDNDERLPFSVWDNEFAEIPIHGKIAWDKQDATVLWQLHGRGELDRPFQPYKERRTGYLKAVHHFAKHGFYDSPSTTEEERLVCIEARRRLGEDDGNYPVPIRRVKVPRPYLKAWQEFVEWFVRD